MNYIPLDYRKSIFDIDLKKIKEDGYKILFFDLDNTIADYETHYPDDKTIDFFKTLKEMGFEPYILSNNHKPRIEKFEEGLKVKGFYSLRKPFTKRIKKYILSEAMNKDEILWIGDQAVTDVRCAHKLGIKSILLDPLKKSTEHWYTRINRMVEKSIFKQVKKKLFSIYSELGLEKRYE